MISFYEIHEGTLVNSDKDSATITIYTSQDESEKQKIMNSLDITKHDIESALDPEEISRIEFTSEHTYIIWKQPNNVSFEQNLKFEVSSVGIFLNKNKLTIISNENIIHLSNVDFKKLISTNDFVLKFLLYTIRHFFSHLKAIKQISSELQIKLNTSMGNNYLLQMFALGESLIYYLNALESNLSVLTKLRGTPDKIKLSQDDIELLDDIIIEQQQCNRQTQIYSSVLSGLMDARGNIINNNMNLLLRNLTVINIVFLPLTLLTGILGMSEYTIITGGEQNWKISYSIFMIAIIIIGWITWILINKNSKIKNKNKY